MKLVVAIVLVSSVAAAEPASDLVLADLGLHVIGIGEQHAMSPRIAAQVDLDYYAPWTQLKSDDRAITDIAGAVLRARVVLYKDAAPAGWWLSPFVQGGVAWTNVAGMRESGAVFAAGASVGYSWLFGKLDLAIGVGAQYHYAQSHDPVPGFSGVWPHADLMVGWAL